MFIDLYLGNPNPNPYNNVYNIICLKYALISCFVCCNATCSQLDGDILSVKIKNAE